MSFSHYLMSGMTLLILPALLLFYQRTGQHDGPPLETGVSKVLADYRQQVLSQVAYTLQFEIPAQQTLPIPASETLSFHLKENNFPLQIDFKEKTHHLKGINVNGHDIRVIHNQEHIVISPEFLQTGENKVSIRFIAGNLSLNRNEDFLYTLLVPDRARTVFPCFDQPNLKATFQLSLTVPSTWKALTNAPLKDSLITGGRKTYHFHQSDTLSTYLFSFAAGRFDQVSREAYGQPIHFLHRETDTVKIRESMTPIFQIHQDALRFMEEYTQIPYPFQKFDFIAIPDFQYGGMEHAGAINYKSSALFLDEGATQDQKIARSSLISHETAHMWFGDLVTMRWFNDVWMKEVFANFMADKITQVALPDANFDLKFLMDHFPAAYQIDRTAGANPIRQPLSNLQEAGTLYGGIIYHKAPIVMRQLERLMGPDAFRQGLRVYLKKYAHGNASWPDLIRILDDLTPVDLQSWNEVWVDETGRPKFTYQLNTEEDKVSALVITQQGEDGSDRLWPQLFEIALVYPDRTEEFSVSMNQPQVTVASAAGKEKPLFVVFNTTGQGYGLFPVDALMLPQLYTIQHPVTRAAAYINLYENMLAGQSMSPQQLLDIVRKGLSQETEELNLTLLTDQLSNLYWQFTLPDRRKRLAVALEEEIWQALQQNPDTNQKKILLKAYQSIALSQQAQDRLYAIWDQEQPPAGVILAEDDYTSLALALAVRAYPTPNQILSRQIDRIENPDRKKRLQFLVSALSPEEQVRDTFFAFLANENNREKEAWVVVALGYLHHPLRASSSEKYLQESLELLEEIQQTGDIFFPQNWLQATFGDYQSPEAARIVRTFLETHPKYNPRLKAKILQATDKLFRAEKLLYASH